MIHWAQQVPNLTLPGHTRSLHNQACVHNALIWNAYAPSCGFNQALSGVLTILHKMAQFMGNSLRAVGMLQPSVKSAGVNLRCVFLSEAAVLLSLQIVC